MKSTMLRAKGWDCIATAHAFAVEPQLFSGVALEDRPPSWTEMVLTPDTKDDSFAIGVWGALEDYDWVDLIFGAWSGRIHAPARDEWCDNCHGVCRLKVKD